MHRRRFTASLLAAPAVLSRSARAATPPIAVAGFAGRFQAGFDAHVLGAFRKSHPDIPVNFYPFGNSIQIWGLLHGQAQAPKIDVALLEAGVAIAATGDTVLEKLDAATVPVIDDLIPGARIPKAAGVGLMLDSLALMYNTNQLDVEPAGWRDFWDPDIVKRIAIVTPPDPLALALSAMAGRLYGPNIDFLRGLEVGITALSHLLPRIALWDPYPDIYTALAYGDAAAGAVWNASARYQMAQTPGHLAAIVPDDGTLCRITTVNLVKHGPSPDGARVLINWLLGPEGQKLLAETMYFAPVNPKADIAPEALAKAGAGTDTVARRFDVDWYVLDSIREQMPAVWRKHNLMRT